jgi:hypothetical protein
MNIKQKTVAGVCNAMRCTSPAVGAFGENEFCQRHLNEAQGTQTPGNEEAKALALAAKDFADEALSLGDLIIEDQETLDMVGGVLVDIKTQWKMLEEKRTSITKPLLQAKNAADALFKPALTALVDAEKALKGKIDSYFTAIAAAKIEALTMGEVQEAIEMAAPVLSGGVGARAVLDYVLEDLSLVPREWLCLDQSAVRIAMSRDKNIQIPGIRFFEKQTVSVRT